MFPQISTFLLVFFGIIIPEFTLLGIPVFVYTALFSWPSMSKILKYKPIILGFSIYLFTMLIASLFGSNLNLFYRIFLMNMASLIFALSLLAMRSSRLGIILLIILILECVLSIGQYHQLPGYWILPEMLSEFVGVIPREGFNYEEIYRSRGLHVLIHKAGPTLVFLFLACFSFYHRKSWFRIFIIPGAVYALFCTQSRSVVFALIIGIAYFVFFRKKLNFKTISIILVAIIGFIIFSSSLNLGRFVGDNVGRSDLYRFQSYQYAFDNFFNHPLFGHAFDSPFTVHSVLLRILAEFGLIVGFSYLLFYAILWWSSIRLTNARMFRIVVIVAFLNSQAHSSGLLFYDITELPLLLLIYKNLS